MPKLMIATPSYGEIFYAPYVRSVLALARFAHKQKMDFIFEYISNAEVSEARTYPVTPIYRQDRCDAPALGNRQPVVGVVAPNAGSTSSA